MSAFSVGICETKNKMSEIGELRQQDNSGDPISAGAIIHELDLVNKLLARAEEAEAALESAQKMCDHWEKKAAERLESFNECRTMLGDRIELLRKNRDEWAQIARENESRAEKAEAELSRFMNMPSCSPELFLRSAQRTEKPAPVDWERVRIDAAIATMQGMWACPDTNFTRPMEVIAVECADALVAELQKKEVQG